MDYVIMNFVMWTFSCHTSVQYLLLETEFLTLSLISSHLSFSKIEEVMVKRVGTCAHFSTVQRHRHIHQSLAHYCYVISWLLS